MRELTKEERRTIRIGSIVLGVYLLLFMGVRGSRAFGGIRGEYERLVLEAKRLKTEVVPFEAKAEAVQKWMESMRLDPVMLVRASVVGQASAALQKHATASGLQLPVIRETQSRGGEKEIGSIQLESAGPVPALLGFLGSISNLGVPLIVDSVQLNSDPMRPGLVKMSLVLILLDFEQWKNGEVPRA